MITALIALGILLAGLPGCRPQGPPEGPPAGSVEHQVLVCYTLETIIDAMVDLRASGATLSSVLAEVVRHEGRMSTTRGTQFLGDLTRHMAMAIYRENLPQARAQAWGYRACTQQYAMTFPRRSP